MKKALYVDAGKLDSKIQASGLKQVYLADTLGLSKQSFTRKKNGETPFRIAEAFCLCTLLNIPDSEKEDIFFPKNSE